MNVTQRMAQTAQRPIRKIKVKEHLNPGRYPTDLHILQDELTVRLSKRCEDIAKLPPTDFGKRVTGWYTQTCKELFEFTDMVEDLRRELPKTSLLEKVMPFWKQGPKVTKDMLAPASEDLEMIVYGSECQDPALKPIAKRLNSKLLAILEAAVARHKPVVTETAREVTKIGTKLHVENAAVQDFLTRFHRQRIAVRLLIGHCVALSRPLPLDNMVGIFCTKTPIEEIVVEAVTMAEELCMITYGCIPTVEISSNDTGHPLLYIPSHLQHMIFEMVKNAMRAVIEKEQQRCNSTEIDVSNLPPITIHWTNNPTNCTFEIRDKGPGIPPHLINNVFLFHYSTANTPPKDEVAVMAGFGYGLPLSRLYARFLKGDIWLESDSNGTCVFIRLKGSWDPEELI